MATAIALMQPVETPEASPEPSPLPVEDLPQRDGHRILVVDDEPRVLEALQRALRKQGYRLIVTTSCAEALRKIEGDHFAVVITDQRMPEMQGTDLLARIQALDPDVVRIVLTGYMEFDIARDAVNRGAAFRLLTKPWTEEDLLTAVEEAVDQYALRRERDALRNIVRRQNEMLREHNRTLEKRVEERTEESRTLRRQAEQRFFDTVRVLGSLAELHSNVIGSHSVRVSRLSRDVARRLKIGEEALRDLEIAATLHDIGKVGVATTVLSKPDATLTRHEREQLRQHPVHGERILRSISGMEEAARIVRHHHENFDGTGYPDTLHGRDIPIGARIVAAVDAYDRACNTRDSLRSATPEKAVALVAHESPARFDPEVVAALQECVQERLTRQEENELEIRVHDLEPGMILSRDLRTRSGLLLLAQGKMVQEKHLARILRYHKTVSPLLDSIFVYRRCAD